MNDESAAGANTGSGPQYDPALERVQNELAWLRDEFVRNPKPSDPREGFRRWKMRNLIGRWAAAQAEGRHELATTQMSAHGAETWICTCGLLVPANRDDFDANAFHAEPGHRTMPEITTNKPSPADD